MIKEPMQFFLSRKILIRAFICCVLAMIPFPDLENQIYDLQMRVRGYNPFAKSSDVVIVEINKEEFEELKRIFDPDAKDRAQKNHGTWFEKFESIRDQFFWNDSTMEAVLRRLLEQNPRFLLVNFFYSESLVHLRDQAELKRLVRDHRVIWASHFDVDQKFIKPAAELTGSENYGFINLQPDVDGVVRRAHLIYQNHASLPFRALVDKPQNLPQNIPLTVPFLINYAGRSGSIPTCRVTDIFHANNNPQCGSFTNRNIIFSPVGNAIMGADHFLTPIGSLSRAEILANILLTAIKEKAVYTAHYYYIIFAVFLHILLLGWAILNRAATFHVLLAFNLLFTECVLATLSIAFVRLHIPLLPFAGATFTSYIVFVWLKFGQQEQKRWQAHNRAQSLKELDEYKSNFISLMSHDLKTPIAKIQALTERLAREALSLTSDQKLILAGIQKSNDELTKYILSILNFQKIETKELALNKKSHDINALIDEICDRLQALASEKNIQIQKDLEPMFLTEFDDTLIRQVLNNLIENAIKYNAVGTEIRVKSEDQGEFIVVSVKDNGQGIGEEEQSRLFKKFSRKEKLTAERVKGTGLGLYLCKYFIELHGGHIEYSSTPGAGSEFRFFLPVASASE